jgi:hypothetical protein
MATTDKEIVYEASDAEWEAYKGKFSKNYQSHEEQEKYVLTISIKFYHSETFTHYILLCILKFNSLIIKI